MKCKLADVCNFVKEHTTEFDESNYVSTENMLPDKGGITAPSNMPGGSVVAYSVGDVLVSNIRPYFRKIWFADRNGGCSADVLVFRAKENCDKLFLRYALSSDAFFDYATSTSKGTKMPRGDKAAIMDYDIGDLPPLPTQRAIAATLFCLDDKIELNNHINANLKAQAQAIFKSWFVDFEPFKDGKFVDSELGRIPKGWRVGTLGEIAKITSGKRPPSRTDQETIESFIPIVGASSIMGYTQKELYNSPILVIGRVGTHGIVQRFRTKCWASDNTLVIMSNYYEFVYQILKTINYESINRGTTQPLITQADINKNIIIIPDDDSLYNFESHIGALMNYHHSLEQQSRTLAAIRNTLLPKLMSGEVEVKG
jgi:type I restriction enzyme S subunit